MIPTPGQSRQRSTVRTNSHEPHARISAHAVVLEAGCRWPRSKFSDRARAAEEEASCDRAGRDCQEEDNAFASRPFDPLAARLRAATFSREGSCAKPAQRVCSVTSHSPPSRSLQRPPAPREDRRWPPGTAASAAFPLAASSGFLGIPYAAPPVGDLRWKPPQPHGHWTGVREATAFANHCPQTASPFGLASTTEDCLYLNIFRPARDGDDDEDADEEGDDSPEEGLAVMVWIHGGALLVGESDDYDPVRLVQHGVVVVTINYRLGVLGFLAHPALSAESPVHASGNYGLMDQQAALRWVERNIASFGGDPRRVTIFGESAGGLSVHSHLASPLSAGLFQRAIVQSGAYALAQPSLSQAEAQGQAVAIRAGCTDQTAACLRARPVQTLLDANRDGSVIPDVDGHVLTQTIGASLASGQFNAGCCKGYGVRGRQRRVF